MGQFLPHIRHVFELIEKNKPNLEREIEKESLASQVQTQQEPPTYNPEQESCKSKKYRS